MLLKLNNAPAYFRTCPSPFLKPVPIPFVLFVILWVAFDKFWPILGIFLKMFFTPDILGFTCSIFCLNALKKLLNLFWVVAVCDVCCFNSAILDFATSSCLLYISISVYNFCAWLFNNVKSLLPFKALFTVVSIALSFGFIPSGVTFFLVSSTILSICGFITFNFICRAFIFSFRLSICFCVWLICFSASLLLIFIDISLFSILFFKFWICFLNNGICCFTAFCNFDISTFANCSCACFIIFVISGSIFWNSFKASATFAVTMISISSTVISHSPSLISFIIKSTSNWCFSFNLLIIVFF